MQSLSLNQLITTYWTGLELQTNLLIFLNLLGALFLGGLVGYERSYHGRAAGIRTYALVCMASTAITAVAGYPHLWFGALYPNTMAGADPTRVIQGVVTGIGFLGAGVIVKDGFQITGLASAASIWTASCIGVLLGVGFYAAAILLAVLCMLTMLWGNRIESSLPTHPALSLRLILQPHSSLNLQALNEHLQPMGYEISTETFSIYADHQHMEIKCIATVADKERAIGLDALAKIMRAWPDVQSISMSHARN
ncbi:MgtC/SapB family protein [Curvibacter sp. CHRR-16]|uniref:MgtC/SapB family protein n=1 Tax=Curvibacter sp. CHRR-16 TaxID=2835872 RepID=UPI001BD918F7|nr:MgtC/SapB family protein [Curvibacter sp. CHRR-16]MBT0570757.1 MgtC/SapB family protein [Curvibacter sp. CHRR-16]